MLGFCAEEEEGEPPVNVHAHDVGMFELMSVNDTVAPSQTVVALALKEATGGVPQVLWVMAPDPQTFAISMLV